MNRLPHHRTEVVERFIGQLADNHTFPNSTVLRSLCGPVWRV